MMDLLVYDVELNREIKSKQDWKNINPSWFGSAVVYSYLKDRYYFFLHQKGLHSLRSFLNKSMVITFNGINFDSCIVFLQSTSKQGIFIRHKEYSWTEYDIFLQCMKGLYKCKSDLEARKKISPGGFKLNDIAKNTLKVSKAGNGAMAPILYQQRKFDELFSYNLQDVRITKLLFDHINEFGWIVNRDKKKIKIERSKTWYLNSLKKSVYGDTNLEDTLPENFSKDL